MQYIFLKVINRLFSLLKFINAYTLMGVNSHLLTTALRIYYDYTNARYNIVTFVNYLRVLCIISLGSTIG